MALMFILQVDPKAAYIARINCSHLDVAYGLYNSLKSSISDSTYSMDHDEVLPIDLSLTDSEISILTKYTQSQVSNAPQYILLGVTEWCRVTFPTDYYAANINYRRNLTATCQEYHGLNLFDYRTLLSNNDLTIILAYAYESSYEDDKSYYRTVKDRGKKFHIVKIISIVQIVLQTISFVATLIAYGNRGPAKDLSRIPLLTLNMIAIVTMTAGVCMIATCSITTLEITRTQKEVREGMSSFGINLVMGKVFFALLWSAFAFSCLCMFSWIVPLWCANPPDLEYLDDEEHYNSHHDTTTLLERGDEHFVPRPYNMTRQTKKKPLRKTSSRLFDEVIEEVHSDHESSLASVSEREEFVLDKETQPRSMIEQSSREHTESELRRLGEKMSRKLSVRQIARPSRQRLDILPEKEDTKHLLYSDTPFANHQYPQELPRINEGERRQRSTSLSQQTRTLSDTVLRTRMLLDTDRTNDMLRKPLASMNPFKDMDYTRDDGASVLDEQEMDYLDNAHLINKIPQ